MHRSTARRSANLAGGASLAGGATAFLDMAGDLDGIFGAPKSGAQVLIGIDLLLF
jgi:hypothetical protein